MAISIKSITIRPDKSLNFICLEISSAASIFVLRAVFSIFICFVDWPEFISIATKASVGLITTPGVTFRMFQALANKRINIKVISTSEIKISVLINKKDTKKALVSLHKEFKLNK